MILLMGLNGCAQTDGSLSKLKAALSSGDLKSSASSGTASADLAAASDHSDAVIAKATELKKAGNTEIALQILAKAHSKNPENEDLRRAYAITALEAGNPQLSYKLTSPQHAQANKDARQLSIRGAALSLLGKHKKAEQAFTSALALSPDDPNLLNNLGMALALKGEAKKAESFLRRAALVAESDRARQNLALVVSLQGRMDEAKKISPSKHTLSPTLQKTSWNSTVKSSLGGP